MSSPEPVPTSAGELDRRALGVAAALDQILAAGRPEEFGPAALQSLMAAMCRVYRAQIDAGAEHLPLSGHTAVAPTDVMVTCGGLLRAANLQVFELGMWQSFTGR